jgi:hypothetical protein
MGKPGTGKLTTTQRRRLVTLAKKNTSLWKEIVRKRRHSIAHALAENKAFRAAAKKSKII